MLVMIRSECYSCPPPHPTPLTPPPFLKGSVQRVTPPPRSPVASGKLTPPSVSGEGLICLSLNPWFRNGMWRPLRPRRTAGGIWEEFPSLWEALLSCHDSSCYWQPFCDLSLSLSSLLSPEVTGLRIMLWKHLGLWRWMEQPWADLDLDFHFCAPGNASWFKAALLLVSEISSWLHLLLIPSQVSSDTMPSLVNASISICWMNEWLHRHWVPRLAGYCISSSN